MKSAKGTHTFTFDVGFSTPVIGFHFGLSLDTKGSIAITPAASEGLSFGWSVSVNKGALCGGRSSEDALSAGVVSVSVTKSKSGKSTNVGIGGGRRFGYDSILSAQTYMLRDNSHGACRR